ncbi:MAG: hypothetical protein ACOYKZ_05145 [Chlamydiia bacterium]
MSPSAIFTSPGSSSGAIYSAASVGAAEKSCPTAACCTAGLALFGASLLLGTVSVLAFMQVLPLAVATLAVLQWGAGGGALVCGALSLWSVMQGGSRGQGSSLPAAQQDSAVEQVGQESLDVQSVPHAESKGSFGSNAELLQPTQSDGSSVDKEGGVAGEDDGRASSCKKVGSSVQSNVSSSERGLQKLSPEELLFDYWWNSQVGTTPETTDAERVSSSSPKSSSEEESRLRDGFARWMHARSPMVKLSVTGLLKHLLERQCSSDAAGSLIRAMADSASSEAVVDEVMVRESCADIVRGLESLIRWGVVTPSTSPRSADGSALEPGQQATERSSSPDAGMLEEQALQGWVEDVLHCMLATERGLPHTRLQDRPQLQSSYHASVRVISGYVQGIPRRYLGDSDGGSSQDEVGVVEISLRDVETPERSHDYTASQSQQPGCSTGESLVQGSEPEGDMMGFLAHKFSATPQILQKVVLSVARHWMEVSSEGESQPAPDMTSASGSSEMSETSDASSMSALCAEGRVSPPDVVGLDDGPATAVKAQFVLPNGTRKELSSAGSNVWFPVRPFSADWKIEPVEKIMWASEATVLYQELQSENDEPKSLEIERFSSWLGRQSDTTRSIVTACLGTMFSADRPEEWVIVGLLLMRSIQAGAQEKSLGLSERNLHLTCERLRTLPQSATTDDLIDSLQSLCPDDVQLSDLIRLQRNAGTAAQILAQHVVAIAVQHCFTRIA